MIAASAGVDIDSQPFRPILRGLRLTGGPPRYLQADISGRSGDDSTISGVALWWPPDKLAGRYLAPYLSSQAGDAPDVMPEREHAIPIAAAFDPAIVDIKRGSGELSDLPQTPRPFARSTCWTRAARVAGYLRPRHRRASDARGVSPPRGPMQPTAAGGQLASSGQSDRAHNLASTAAVPPALTSE